MQFSNNATEYKVGRRTGLNVEEILTVQNDQETLSLKNVLQNIEKFLDTKITGWSSIERCNPIVSL